MLAERVPKFDSHACLPVPEFIEAQGGRLFCVCATQPSTGYRCRSLVSVPLIPPPNRGWCHCLHHIQSLRLLPKQPSLCVDLGSSRLWKAGGRASTATFWERRRQTTRFEQFIEICNGMLFGAFMVSPILVTSPCAIPGSKRLDDDFLYKLCVVGVWFGQPYYV